ncbi:hypothetical protein Tco_0478725 [Tanacetum coccineum]
MIDYSLWEVIKNGNASRITKVVEGVETIIAPTTAEEKTQRRCQVIIEVVEKRFGGNDATKKTQRNLLKQQYENFTTSSLEVLDQTFNMLQKHISQLEIHGESISQEDVNQKFLRSLSPKWNTNSVCGGQAEIDTLRESSFQNIRPRRFLRSGSHSNVGCKKSCQSSKYGSDLGQITSSLIPWSRGSFDVIMGMDWLSKRKFVIVCHEKVVRIPLEGDEILQVHGERTQGVVKTLMNTKHGVHLKLVLELLRKEKLYAKFTKSESVKNREVPTKPSEI